MQLYFDLWLEEEISKLELIISFCDFGLFSRLAFIYSHSLVSYFIILKLTKRDSPRKDHD